MLTDVDWQLPRQVNQLNYLAPRGSSDSSSYEDGNLAVKFKGDSFPAQGDLYFKIFSADFKEIDGKKILLGSTIEDLGGGKGIYKFQPDESRIGVADFESLTSDVDFDSEEGVISGEISDEPSEAVYKFETIYPFKNFRVYGDNTKLNVDNLRMAYSFDNKNWVEIPADQFDTNKQIQFFDFSQLEKVSHDLIYIKIYPKVKNTEEKSGYGIKNFRFEADLILK